MDEDDAKNSKKGLSVDNEDDYGQLGMGMGDDSSSDDSDDAPIDDLEVKPDADGADKKEDETEDVEKAVDSEKKESADAAKGADETGTDPLLDVD